MTQVAAALGVSERAGSLVQVGEGFAAIIRGRIGNVVAGTTPLLQFQGHFHVREMSEHARPGLPPLRVESWPWNISLGNLVSVEMSDLHVTGISQEDAVSSARAKFERQTEVWEAAYARLEGLMPEGPIRRRLASYAADAKTVSFEEVHFILRHPGIDDAQGTQLLHDGRYDDDEPGDRHDDDRA